MGVYSGALLRSVQQVYLKQRRHSRLHPSPPCLALEILRDAKDVNLIKKEPKTSKRVGLGLASSGGAVFCLVHRGRRSKLPAQENMESLSFCLLCTKTAEAEPSL